MAQIAKDLKYRFRGSPWMRDMLKSLFLGRMTQMADGLSFIMEGQS